MSTSWWLDEQNVFSNTGLFGHKKECGIQIHAIICMNLENIKIKKVNHKRPCIIFYLYEMSGIGKSTETERLAVA